MIKTYVLLETLNSTAPIFQTTADGKREQIKKIPRHRPYLQVTFQDEKGVNKTIRYKSSSNTIWMDEQIKVEKMDANAKFTQAERDGAWFKFGILVTDKKILQEFLEAHPECEGFKGSCDDVKKPCFKLVDEDKEDEIKNDDIKLRVKAAAKIIELDLPAAQALLIRINGSYFKTPTKLPACQNLLMDFLDNTNEDGLKEIMKPDNEITEDEKVTILIGRLIQAGHLSFDAVEGTISKKSKDGEWLKLREMSTEHSMEVRMALFTDFLISKEGKDLKKDLEKDLSEIQKSEKEKVEKTT